MKNKWQVLLATALATISLNALTVAPASASLCNTVINTAFEVMPLGAGITGTPSTSFMPCTANVATMSGFAGTFGTPDDTFDIFVSGLDDDTLIVTGLARDGGDNETGTNTPEFSLVSAFILDLTNIE